jgi:hypothetical protein
MSNSGGFDTLRKPRVTLKLIHMGRRWVLFGVALTLLAEQARAQNPATSLKHLISAKKEESKSDNDGDADSLGKTIDRVGQAFEVGDAEALEDCLVPRKVYLSLRSRGDEAGYYGRSQVKFMFAKLFRERKTDSFIYDPVDVEVSGDGTAHFRADWSYMVLDEDDVVTEHLRFRLERTKDDWRISEIRAQSR